MCSKESATVSRHLSSSRAALHKHMYTPSGPVAGRVSQGCLSTDYNAGLFETVVNMEAWFNERQKGCKDLSHVDEQELDFSEIFSELVFCHLDLYPRSLTVDPTRMSGSSTVVMLAAILLYLMKPN
nr:hypothetical protein CFP56_38757 [Quercus suber]